MFLSEFHEHLLNSGDQALTQVPSVRKVRDIALPCPDASPRHLPNLVTIPLFRKPPGDVICGPEMNVILTDIIFNGILINSHT